jgi:predicted TIM-barrel fold metal-dependent hydrolase
LTVVDAFTHVLPAEYVQEVRAALGADPFGAIIAALPPIYDVEARLRTMDEAGVSRQVLTLSYPPIEELFPDPALAARLARVANDGIAELAARHPDRFLPVGTAVLSDVEAALKESERCLGELGMKGMLIYTSVLGQPLDDPRFLPFFELMAQRGRPIWLHPTRPRSRPDYSGEEESRYWVWQVFGWPYETAAAMTRLIFSGILDRFPGLTFITHHAGALVPFFERRIESCMSMFDRYLDGSRLLDRLPRPLMDYYRSFYVDTAVQASPGALLAAYAFYGPERILFGTDAPYPDAPRGTGLAAEGIEAVRSLPIPEAHKGQILWGNAQRLLDMAGR